MSLHDVHQQATMNVDIPVTVPVPLPPPLQPLPPLEAVVASAVTAAAATTLPTPQGPPRPFSFIDFLKALRAETINVFSAKDQLRPYFLKVKSFLTDFSPQNQQLTKKQRVYLLIFGGALASLIFLYKLTRPPPKRLTFASFKPSEHADVYDVIVVGAGPSGASCAYHLARKGKKVLLLEKKAFPRDKYCGEAVTHYAQEQLSEMGVLQGIIDDNLAYSVDVGGFVSPCGNSFVGSSREVMEYASPLPTTSSVPMSSSSSSRPSSPRPPSPAPAPSATGPQSRPPSPRPPSPSPASPAPTANGTGFKGVLTIKRFVLDSRLAKAAQDTGAVLIENMNVISAEFDANTGEWTVECKDEQANNLVHNSGSHPSSHFHRGSVSIGNSFGNSGGLPLSTDSNTTPSTPSTPTTPITPPAFPQLSDTQDKRDSVDNGNSKILYRGRALVCADGAPSRLARSLGIVHSEPTAVCSRSYVQPPHAFKWDGLLFYPPSILPGCCAIVRHVGGELSYLTFVNPAIGGQVKEEDLSRLHHEFIKTDPYISQALGPFIYLERMKAASLRIGGVGTGISLNNFRTVSTARTPTGNDRSYGEHLLVIGDAAGFVDPFTGLGLQYALEGGKIAAGVLLEGFYKRDLSAQFLCVFENRWGEAFGNHFYWSMKIGQLLCRFPILLDATAKLIQRRGDQFLAEWMQAMTGTRSKTWFLSLDVWPFLFAEIIMELIRRQFRQKG